VIYSPRTLRVLGAVYHIQPAFSVINSYLLNNITNLFFRCCGALLRRYSTFLYNYPLIFLILTPIFLAICVVFSFVVGPDLPDFSKPTQVSWQIDPIVKADLYTTQLCLKVKCCMQLTCFIQLKLCCVCQALGYAVVNGPFAL
jgi:hypothetical protein